MEMQVVNVPLPARAYPRSDAQIHRPNSAKNGRGLPHQERVRLKKKALDPVRIGTLNVGTMNGRGREVSDMMERRKIQILLVQETRWIGNKAKEIGAGYKLFYSGGNAQGRNGVGIILAKELKNNVLEVKRRNDRLMKMKIVLDGEVLNVMSAYAPQVGCTDEEKDEFWRQLDEEVITVPEEEALMIGGDLNGHVGRDNQSLERIHGGWAVGDRNLEGERIIDFCVAFDMAVVNTFFKKRMEQLVTYKSGGHETQIDYVLCRRTDLKEMRNCKTYPGECVTQQHRTVAVDWIKKRKKRGKQKIVPKIKWWKLKQPVYRDRYRDRVLEVLGNWDYDDVDTWWEENSSVLIRIGKEVLGMTRGKGPRDKETWWWNAEVQEKISLKRDAKRRYDGTGDNEDGETYRIAKKEAKAAVARARQESVEEAYKELETREGEKKIFKIAEARNKATKDITHIRQIKNEEGAIMCSSPDIQSRWKQYFERLLNEENERLIRGEGVPNYGLTREIEREEVKWALNRMKDGKATGPDEIPAEAWKSLGEFGIDMLWDLMKKIRKKEKMPNKWRKSILVPIFKEKGDIQDCNNYRGIKLMSHTMKIWERIIERRLREETQIGEEQFGFMPGRRTTDAIFALRQMIEKHREKQRELHLVFIDLEKAYDRIPRQEVWRCLREKGTPEIYVRLIKDMYERAATQVRTSEGMTDMFEVRVGLHQGSSLSPYLFNVVMDVITKDVREEAPWTMMFADDVVLCDETAAGLEEKLERWRDALESRGLKISRSKTEYMCCNEENERARVHLQGNLVKKVEKFKYLGSCLKNDGELDDEVNNKIQAGWKNWRKMSGVLCDSRMNVKLKGKVFKAVVRPAMTYAAETWPIKKKLEKKMDVAEMRMLRWMVGITRRDKIRNELVRGTVKVTEVSRKVQEKRLQWYGHIMRRDGDYVGRRVMEMEVPGRRRRGRPKLRWRECIDGDLREKSLNPNDVHNRAEWRRLSKNSDPA